MPFLRNPFLLLGINLAAIAGSTYLLREHHIYNLEEHEARMDELEGTLRGHIGVIEEALDRLEGKATEADRGKKMDSYYGKRGRDENALLGNFVFRDGDKSSNLRHTDQI